MTKPLFVKALIATLLLLLVTETSEARRRRHHADERDFVVVTPDGRAQSRDRRERRSPRITLDAVVPPGWRLQPTEPGVQSKRFVAPDGTAWLTLYKSAADTSVADHMKSIAFPSDDETLTNIQGERSWIAVAGYKDSRMFFRKAMLSCGGRVWHHVAFEYPIEMKVRLERSVLLAAEAIQQSQNDCDDAVAEKRQ